MTKGDQQWIGKMVFNAKHRLSDTAVSELWWHPPPVRASSDKLNPESYVLWRLCLWMLWRARAVDLKCPACLLQ